MIERNCSNIVISLTVLVLTFLFSPLAFSQESIDDSQLDEEVVIIPPLFEYVVAPEDLPDLQSRTDYLMEHFWDPFDFKNNSIVDQNALNHAFGVYVQAMAFASDNKINESVKKLIDNIKKSPGLTFQFAKAAEENLYGPRAELWGDYIYSQFIKNLLENKNIKESQKKHFESQYEIIQRSLIGASFPQISVKNMEGTEIKLNSRKKFTLYEFTPPSCENCNYSNLRLDISAPINDLIENESLEVDIIVLDDKKPIGNFPSKWNIYYSPEENKLPDIRIYPCFYVVDNEGKIIGKNMHVDDAILLIEQVMENK